jgi:cysteinyl-tRNA synthetase
MDLRIYNSLNKKEEVFKPHIPNTIGVYTCGPTVYDYVTIGNWRTYTLGDLLIRTLGLNGYKPTYVMNITDVGHLTGDNLGDADTGEDRLEKASRREGKSAWEIATFYTDDFLQGYKKLNLTQPKLFAKATDHIPEQILLVEQLFARGFAYQISDGIYFDTVSYENAGFTYGELSNLQLIKEGVRVEINHEKKNPRDFALWKFSSVNEGEQKRHMEWPSPWGVGFPGWHIECSAMSMKYLGAQFAIHVGGEDLKSTHHPNEIAQSQGATGLVPFVAYWMHGAFLQVDGGKMGKSLGNAYSLHDIESHGFSPLALRYFYLTAHYRSPLNFTWEALDGASRSYAKLLEHFRSLGTDSDIVNQSYMTKFQTAINNDLHMPQALAVVWEMLKDTEVPNADKRATLLMFDTVLGFNLADVSEEIIPEAITVLASKRAQARLEKNWSLADTLRQEIASQGYEIVDTDSGQQLKKI